MVDVQSVVIRPDSTLRDAIVRIDQAGIQAALVVDADGRLLGMITDGDVRRAILRGSELTSPCSEIMNRNPVTASSEASPSELLSLMRSRVLHHMPLVDAQRRLTGIVTIDDLIGAIHKPNWVVLMAGGLGLRLRPLTSNCPKPMLPIRGKPILETILEGFAEQGFRNFYLSVNYLADMVREHFADGSRWGVSIQYLEEEVSLGTAGALRLLPERPKDPLFVMNGDLLTRVRFDSMLNFHSEHQAAATMAVREYDMQVPYGVVRMNGGWIAGIEEKPVQRYYVNAGIYTLSPEALDHVKGEGSLDMPELFQRLVAAQRPTSAFPLPEYWLDVGRIEEFERAQKEWLAGEAQG